MDPSIQANTETLWRGIASDLSEFTKGSLDVIIYGFCLYLCDRDELFKIVSEGDSALKDGGYIIVHDFYACSPHARNYKHKEGIKSFKMNYASLWLGNPAYSPYSCVINGEGDDATSVVILKKNLSAAWPLRD